ncbi:lytic polysaccharide monooxygenase [Lophiostoma macrostomum CBS 122681]|uniref:lytic cellulose monooxygenase (C4-dehydrogenating) n=1 Tax=Lophiostoma macrostomum CBS 122681 TaxID=1314788 RepID=A0A6A6T6U5_9PLEO|nr:lytic polysaccharide monooxygenase [Lophiostoma macrostomum CBS 122681]
MVNGSLSEKFQYVRDVVPQPGIPLNYSDPVQYEMMKVFPMLVLEAPMTTCGNNASKSAKKTRTATVLAGTEVGFEVADVGGGIPPYIHHSGPLSAWLSRAPNDDVASYDGLGDWFKIFYLGPLDDTTWAGLGRTGATFNIPKTTPPGEYLLRFESLWPSSSPEPYRAQLFTNCAQVKIVGPGGGVPTGFARFPGTYHYGVPGVTIPKEMDTVDGGKPSGLLEYIAPGPSVWTG